MMSSIEDEKRLVQRGLQSALIPGNRWEVLSTEWYVKWKTYVESDGEEGHDDLFPGPIDNHSLKGKYEEELKPGLVEGDDFILLPYLPADLLFRKYSGGPRFTRDIVNVGTAHAPSYKVSLYRVRVEAYLCDNDTPHPVANDPAKHIVRYFHKTHRYNDVVEALIQEFNISPYRNGVRCWKKEHVPDSEESSGAMDEATTPVPSDRYSDDQRKIAAGSKEGSPEPNSRAEGGDSKRARLGRIMITDLTDWDGEWKHVRGSVDCSIQEVLGEGDSVHLIVEMAATRKPEWREWPRAFLLDKWKGELRVGDVLDVCDNVQHKWYASVVKEVSPQGDLSVHFKGWASNFDEIIPAKDVRTNIRPLYVCTPDRRMWEVGDKVEYRCSPPGAPKSVWLPVTIAEVDSASDRIQVRFSQADKLTALKKYLKDSHQSLDDDAVKKETDGGAITRDPLNEDARYTWCEILGEDICPSPTHIKATATPSSALTTPTSTGGGFAATITNYISKPFQSVTNRFDYSEKHVKGTTEVAGAVGLQNLGNTCFMNSILQCVSNTEALTQLFLTDEFKQQLNSDNPLGHGGKLAVAYGKLIKDMWNNGYCKIIPRDFKVTIGEFQPQFAGYDQQDSQEFLGFLLDGLHEDLNRVQKKPHVSKIESKGRDDVTIASESWRRYLLRNDSELVDRCFGQLKSHVTCTSCGNESVTFDEFSSISLPLPVRNTRPVQIVAQLLPVGSLPVKIDLHVEVSTTMNQLQDILVAKLRELNFLTLGHGRPSTMSMGHTSEGSEYAESMEVEDASRAGTSTSEPSKTSSPHGSNDAYAESYDVVSHSEAQVSRLEGADCSTYEDAAQISEPEPFVTVFHTDKMDTCGSAAATPLPGTDSDNSPVATAGSTATNGASGQQAGAGVFFQFGTLFSSRPSSVFKSYNTAEHGATAVTSFVGKMDSLMAFQLDHRAPEFRSISYHSTYSKAPATKYDPADLDCGYVAVDVSMGTKVKSYNNYERIELGGYPFRIAVPVDCTNRYVHAKVFELSRRFFKEDSAYSSADLQGMPYSIVVTNSYASINKRAVELSDEVFEPPVGGTDILVVLWPSDCEDYVDQDQLTAVRQPPLDEDSEEALAKKNGKGAVLDVYKCFDKFIEREQLAEAETLYCSRCKQHLAPIKKMDLWAAPDILIVQLKRFQYVPGQYFVHREKINDLVDFPVEGLDLGRYVIGPQSPDAPPLYDLYAVSHHMGGLGGGHYTATCKNFLNNKWYNFNDSQVSGTSPESAVTGSAYVLFYKRRRGTLKWAGIVPSSVPMPDE